MVHSIHIKIAQIPPDPVFQHSNIPSLHGIGSRQSQFPLTWPSFRPGGLRARREDQVFDVGINFISPFALKLAKMIHKIPRKPAQMD